MHARNVFLSLSAAVATAAQRPNGTSICDYYTTAVLKNNTAENQYTLLTVLVNTVVIGNYTQPNTGIAVPGILAPGKYNGTDVNLLPYFDGTLKSTNRGGNMGVSVNFLDGGGAAPLKDNKPANDDKSKQYFLLTHLYQFFGTLLGCTQTGNSSAFPAYAGQTSMYTVHKFMDLDAYEVGYFIEQIALAGASLGVAKSDLTSVGETLQGLFGQRCSAPAAPLPDKKPELQAICIRDTCPVAKEPVCDKYEMVGMPATATMSGGMSSATASPTGSVSAVPTAGAAANGISLAAVAGVFALLMLVE